MTRNRTWLVGALALAVIWGAVWAASSISGTLRPTPEKISQFVNDHPLEGLASAEREKIVREVADRMNRLEYDERRTFRDKLFDNEDAFYESLTDDEKILLIELTMESGFQRMMEAFNNMDPDRRQRMVDRALRDLDREEGIDRDRDDTRERLDELDPELYDKMVATGLQSFYQHADASTKLDLAPVLERIEERMRD